MSEENVDNNSPQAKSLAAMSSRDATPEERKEIEIALSKAVDLIKTGDRDQIKKKLFDYDTLTTADKEDFDQAPQEQLDAVLGGIQGMLENELLSLQHPDVYCVKILEKTENTLSVAYFLKPVEGSNNAHYMHMSFTMHNDELRPVLY